MKNEKYIGYSTMEALHGPFPFDNVILDEQTIVQVIPVEFRARCLTNIESINLFSDADDIIDKALIDTIIKPLMDKRKEE